MPFPNTTRPSIYLWSLAAREVSNSSIIQKSRWGGECGPFWNESNYKAQKKKKFHFALGCEIPWTHPEYRKREKDQRDVKNSRDEPRGREVTLTKWHLKTTFVLGAWDQESCRHFLGKGSDEESERWLRWLDGAAFGGQVEGIKQVGLGLETAKIGLDSHLQLLGCLNSKRGKVLLGVEQRIIITWKLRQWKETRIPNSSHRQDWSRQFYGKHPRFKRSFNNRQKLQNVFHDYHHLR